MQLLQNEIFLFLFLFFHICLKYSALCNKRNSYDNKNTFLISRNLLTNVEVERI